MWNNVYDVLFLSYFYRCKFVSAFFAGLGSSKKRPRDKILYTIIKTIKTINNLLLLLSRLVLKDNTWYYKYLSISIGGKCDNVN